MTGPTSLVTQGTATVNWKRPDFARHQSGRRAVCNSMIMNMDDGRRKSNIVFLNNPGRIHMRNTPTSSRQYVDRQARQCLRSSRLCLPTIHLLREQ